ncbi:alkaline phosphatase PhoX [Okeania sp.]|uniref:alkaline phosphatase PhoX n=1 Tax=Okeania sp. TaxID=3100323 RepID=UPI002B4AE8A6|nr:alkaline phosphatase PhoX [Okeania sp.]MEB3341683.1 alkaline phosphatase PhoX [Okeania sp.]
MVLTTQPAQMRGLNSYETFPLFTIGETVNDYTPPGILDGIGAYELDDNTVRALVNHELSSGTGYAYTLANGTELTGARVSYFDIDKDTLEIVDTGLAYDTIIARNGEEVDEASDLEFGELVDEDGSTILGGINRLCSAIYVEANQFDSGSGIVDGIFFTGEETGSGGTEFALDVETNTLYALPWLGRAAWESVTQIDTGNSDTVGILIGDDREAAPLLFYVGEKDETSDDFLERNGLAQGKIYVWAPDEELGDTPDSVVDDEGNPEDPDDYPDPAGFNGTGNSESGTFVEIEYYNPDEAGSAVDTDDDGSIQDELGYDELGFATQAQQDFLAFEAGAFQFSRPEDVATNPEDGTEAVLASTGRPGRFPTDSWGTIYNVDIEFGDNITANLEILYDGDDAGDGQFAGPDFGLRSPDNLDWADNGSIYINEDRSIGDFGQTSGQEASIWRLRPSDGNLARFAQMDRSALPGDPIPQTDGDPDDIGNWESSGILDVSNLFDKAPGSFFLFDVQAHSLRDGVIEEEGLVQGGQLGILAKVNGTVIDPDADNIFRGGNGDDKAATGGGNDRLVGRGGNDRLIGGSGNDVLNGGNDNDRLFGQSGRDRLIGGKGNDVLNGGNGNDRLFGQSGRDNLNGGAGNDILVGGPGRDKFIFNTNQQFASKDLGVDTIRDFRPGVDKIILDGDTFTDGLGSVVYEAGALSYNGVEFATLNGDPDLTAGEDYLIR